MSKVRYHINPFSGMPSICRATRGNCPYGGASGTDYHYKSYEEAQVASQEYMKNNYDLLPSHEAIDPEIEEEITKVDKMYEWDVLDPDSPNTQELLRITSSKELIEAVVQRHSKLSDNWDNLSAVYQNPNLPREFIEDFIRYPNSYTDESQRALAASPALKHDDLMKLVDNSVERDTLIIAHRNPNIDPDWIEEQIGSDLTKMQDVPLIGLLDNPTTPQDYKNRFHQMITLGDLDYPVVRDEVK